MTRVRQPRSDEVSFARLGVIVVVGLAGGLGLSAWAVDRDPDVVEEQDAEELSAAGAATVADRGEESSDDVRAGVSDDPDSALDGAEIDGAEAAIAPPASPTPREEPRPPSAEALPTRSAARLRFVRERVAYLRCGGGEGGSSGGACPRDGTMEAAVWEVLEGLAGCDDRRLGPGRGDLRLAFATGFAPDVLWRDTFADGVVRLDREAVLSCVEEGLDATRSSPIDGDLYVSFRFRLRADSSPD